MNFFDAHFHIIDFNYPVTENQGYIPPSYEIQDYLSVAHTLGVVGGAIVSGSFQGFDQGYLVKALAEMGSNFVGVTQLPFNTSDQEILKLDKQGVRALRFNIKRGGSEDLSKLDHFARRVYELVGWHSELYIDSKNLPTIEKMLIQLPAISIDHLGLSAEGLPSLLRLVERGIRVKATGFGRVQLNVIKTMKQIHAINPNALMFGTDLPSTRADRPFERSDIELIQNNFDDQAIEKIMYENAINWYIKKLPPE